MLLWLTECVSAVETVSHTDLNSFCSLLSTVIDFFLSDSAPERPAVRSACGSHRLIPVLLADMNMTACRLALPREDADTVWLNSTPLEA